MKKYTIEIDQEFSDKIVLDCLKEDYMMIRKSIRELEAKKTLATHEQDDLKADKKFLKAYKRVIRYNMTSYEFDAFMKTVES